MRSCHQGWRLNNGDFEPVRRERYPEETRCQSNTESRNWNGAFHSCSALKCFSSPAFWYALRMLQNTGLVKGSPSNPYFHRVSPCVTIVAAVSLFPALLASFGVRRASKPATCLWTSCNACACCESS